MLKRLPALLLALLLLPLAGAAAETARIVTPGGKLNMRKKPDPKARLAAYIPNGALVETVEVGEEWSQIVYKDITGYVKTEYLLLPSAMVGETVYPDAGDVLLR